MAHQIRTAITQFNTEYGYYPSNGMTAGVGTTGSSLALVLTGAASATNDNPRQIVFLEVPNDFTTNAAGNLTNGGILTPKGFYSKGQSNLSVAVDHDYNGTVTVTNGTTTTNLQAGVAVWFVDPKDSKKTVGTWK